MAKCVRFQVFWNGTVKMNDQGPYYNGGLARIIKVGLNTSYVGLLELICDEMEVDPRRTTLTIQHRTPMIYPSGSKEFSLIDIRKDSHVESLIEMAKAFEITCL